MGMGMATARIIACSSILWQKSFARALEGLSSDGLVLETPCPVKTPADFRLRSTDWLGSSRSMHVKGAEGQKSGLLLT